MAKGPDVGKSSGVSRGGPDHRAADPNSYTHLPLARATPKEGQFQTARDQQVRGEPMPSDGGRVVDPPAC